MQITQIYRYPLKGAAGHALDRVALKAFEALPLDRALALARPDCPFDEAAPAPLAKQNFLMLMLDEEMARFDAAYDEASQRLTILEKGVVRATGQIGTKAGRGAIEAFFAGVFAQKLDRPPRLVTAPGHTFSDVGAKVVSIIGLASIRALEEKLGVEVQPQRFRANFYFTGAEPWAEFDWIGRELQIGRARLRVRKRTERCAATNVNPETAVRDLIIPKALRQHFGHTDMGIYADVIEGGEVARGDRLELAGLR